MSEIGEGAGNQPEPADPAIQALMARLEASPRNFRVISHVYTDQATLFRRTINAITESFAQMEASGPSALFDFSNDPLKTLLNNPYADSIIEQQARIIDLLVLTALGQKIEVAEFQEYAKLLVSLYADFDFLNKAKDSAVLNQTLRAIEKEWQGGTDFSRVQQFFRAGTAGVEYAAKYCGMEIAHLPGF